MESFFITKVNLIQGILCKTKKPIQLTGYQFKQNINNLYFDINKLVDQFPSYQYLEGILFTNFQQFFTKIKECQSFYNLLKHLNIKKNMFINPNSKKKIEIKLISMGILCYNHNVNKNVNFIRHLYQHLNLNQNKKIF